MKYRSDIDGLRAIAVLAVVLFHSGLSFIPGGYVGVDVFFVISGYLITTLIYNEVKAGRFSFFDFYKRRAARLLPALAVTFVFVFLFGFVFYNNSLFDNLGKELFFSSIGAANILFAQGINYFASNEAYQPLIHLWSLGVEEQFYVIWPIILLFTFRFSSKVIFSTAVFLFFLSLWFSVSAVNNELTEGYFLLQYRAYELLVGVIIALYLSDFFKGQYRDRMKQVFSYVGLTLILVPMFILDKESSFPGFNALLPTFGTALIILFPNKGLITKFLSNNVAVFLGLISYPLYLYHQPIISFIAFFQLELSSFELFFWVMMISTLLAWGTYKYIEVPVRRAAHSKNKKKSFVSMFILVSTIPIFATLGLSVAKSGGFEERFKVFNSFALEVSQAHKQSFHAYFERGYRVSDSSHSKVLFLGDSVLQQYVTPTLLMFGFDTKDIDTVTRGGCVLLKGVEFNDKFSDISCNDLRDKIYLSRKTYDYVFISQSWGLHGYDSSVTNFDVGEGKYNRWKPFLDSTIEHFSGLSKKIIVIGAHPSVEGTLKLQPSIMIDKPTFLADLKNLKMTNAQDIKESLSFFNQLEEASKVQVLNPYNIFCQNKQCITNDGVWSYFSDDQHISMASTEFVAEKLKLILKSD